MESKGKGKGLAAMPPPPRKDKPSPDLKAPAPSEKVQFNVRIHAERAIFARVLAAKTGRTPGEVIEEALGLLEAQEEGK